MKRSPAQKFVQGLVRTVVFLSIMILAFLGSYKITDSFYKRKGVNKKDNGIHVEMNGRLDKVAYNLIYAISEDKTIKAALLEILNTESETLGFITIPANSKLTLSSELYKEVLTYNAGAPQIVTVGKLNEVSKKDEQCSFGVTVLNQLLNIDISYYTVMDEADFNEVFEMDKETSYYQLSKECKDSLQSFTEEDIIEKVRAYDKLTKCSLSLNDRLNYTPALDKVKLDEIFYMNIAGNEDDDYFEMNGEMNDTLFQLINEGETGESILAKMGMGEQVSLGKNIMIMNGSRVSGLAASYKDKLVSNGYTVTGIANYERNDVEKTMIMVKEDGVGYDLLAMFKDAEVIVSNTIPDNIDIQIVIGANESILN